MKAMHFGLSLLFCLMAHPAFAQKCSDLFSKDTASSFKVRSAYPESSHKAPLYPYVTVRNIENIFQHTYAYGRPVYGAKAIVLMPPGKEPLVFFFPTGVRNEAWGTHHMNAMKVLLDKHYGSSDQNMVLSLLPYMQGFEFTARKILGRWRIVQLDISSQITELRKISDLEDTQFDQAAIDALVNRIDRSLVSF